MEIKNMQNKNYIIFCTHCGKTQEFKNDCNAGEGEIKEVKYCRKCMNFYLHNTNFFSQKHAKQNKSFIIGY